MTADYSILSLFHEEATTLVVQLHGGLVSARQSPELSESWIDVSVAARRLAALARLTELTPIARLAEALANCCDQQAQDRSARSEDVDGLLRLMSPLVELMNLVEDDHLAQWVADRAEVLERATQAISADCSCRLSTHLETNIAARLGPSGPSLADRPAPEPAAAQPYSGRADVAPAQPGPPNPIAPNSIAANLPDLSVSFPIGPPPLPPTPTPDQNRGSEPIDPPIAPRIAESISEPSQPPEPTRSPDLGLDFSHASMLDLFQLELETQVSILNQGLLSLEENATSAPALEALMRAAHSVKGAARMLGLDLAVNLAHVMEDCFVAAQNGAIVLGSEGIDALLDGTDLLASLREPTEANLEAWLAERQEAFQVARSTVLGLLGSIAPAGTRAAGVGGLGGVGGVDRSLSPTPQSSPPTPATDLIGVGSIVTASNPGPTPADLTAIAPGQTTNQTTNQTPTTLLTSSGLTSSGPPSDSPGIVPSPASPPSSIAPTDPSPRAIASPALTATPIAPEPIASETTGDRVVRVSAENLNRIMGLAGESLVDANWLQLFADSLLLLKRRQRDLTQSLDKMQEEMGGGRVAEEAIARLQTARRQAAQCNQILAERLNDLEAFARRSANLSDRLYREVIASHMRPFGDGVQAFPRMVRDLARKLGKRVKFEIVGKATPVDRDILNKLEAPLTHILRNSADHGIELPADRLAQGKPEEGTIRLEAFHRGGMLAISVTDDGRGIDPDALREKILRKNLATPDMVEQLRTEELLEFIFLPGFSTATHVTEISGRGVGLDIAQSMAREVGGSVRALSQVGQGTSFHFQLPLTLSVLRTLLVEIAGEAYAFPLARIDQIAVVAAHEIAVTENRQYFVMDDRDNRHNIGLVMAHQVLELDQPAITSDSYSVVVIGEGQSRYGVVVDRFLGERDLVVRPLDPRLGKVQDINAAALREDGSLVLILDTADLARSIDRLLTTRRLQPVNAAALAGQKTGQRILVADDSVTIREVERQRLEARGYRVQVAVDGMEAWNALRTGSFAMLVTDIDMPRLTGIELLTNIRNHPTLHSLPVAIVSYKDREEDRLKGLEAGADAYLTKSNFQDNTLLQTIEDLIGPP